MGRPRSGWEIQLRNTCNFKENNRQKSQEKKESM